MIRRVNSGTVFWRKIFILAEADSNQRCMLFKFPHKRFGHQHLVKVFRVLKIFPFLN